MTGIMAMFGQPKKLKMTVIRTGRPAAFRVSPGRSPRSCSPAGQPTTGRGRITVANRRRPGWPRGTARAERKQPAMPQATSTAPPIVGPAMRLALLAPTSKDMAAHALGADDTPIMTRRSGKSADQSVPVDRLARARCQTRDYPHAPAGRATPRSSAKRARRVARGALRANRRRRRSRPRTAPSAASAAS